MGTTQANAAGMLNRAKVRQCLAQQAKARRDLRWGHFPPTLCVLYERIEDVAVLDFNPVLIGHDETGRSAAFFGHTQCFLCPFSNTQNVRLSKPVTRFHANVTDVHSRSLNLSSHRLP